jgi:tripartite-type tricarboxylate transporter receptor subunit TctC
MVTSSARLSPEERMMSAWGHERSGLRPRILLPVLVPIMVVACGAAAAQAEPYPSGNVVRIVVPTTPGPPPDTIGRIIATHLAESEGWRVVVDNRPGALQTLAMEDVLRKPADGLSIFPMSIGAVAVPSLLPGRGLRLERDFAAVVKIATGYNVLVVNPSVPARTLSELVTLLKAQPDKMAYASAVFGAPGHLLGEMFKLQTGAAFQVVPYPNTQQRAADLLSGRTQFAFYNTPTVLDLIVTGKLRALAVTAPARIAALPDVPTVIEAGYPSLVAEDWVGFVVKSGTPDESIARLNAAVNRTLTTREVRDAFTRLGYDAVGGTPAELRQLIASQVAYWTSVVKGSGITAQP